ncbi:glycosyltransferase family 64 protein C4-like isoform X2 [Durio zibethinus]|uniref:Glycosyltransferase family 64 protein C4-like isoform X2 n=1 Tax=Durio zibethinus TaxID=66656 RepID=A0A6P5YWY5_DURZI|nr:glycosyltransferase family 64 protein C4-like isoform X2 [Durio zibethinus]
MRGSLAINRRTVFKLRQIGIATLGSVKIKILLCGCVALTLLAVANRNRDGSSSLWGWTSDVASLDRSSSPRNGRQVELIFDINKEDSLNNRFKEIKDLETDAVFSIDDDVIFPCSSIEFAFTVWQSAPDTMVGYVPRMHWVDETKGKDKYGYGGWWSVWWTGTYSMVLSKAAFFHKKYLKLYTDEMPASIKEYITRNRNCEDIAMSFLVANATGAPPIWVKGKIFEIGSTGISSLGGHSERRTQCLNKFVAEFGRMPLVSTSLKAVDSRNVWFW